MLKLHNTLARKSTEVKPLNPPVVTLYTCGPTVYQDPHIGNWRTFIAYDLLARALRYFGFETKHVLNITDVGHLTSDADEGEDKLAAQAKKERKTAWEIAEEHIRAFEEGLNALNIVRPNILPRATKHITQQIELIKELERKGYTYQIGDGVYFDTSKFKNYGKLAGLKLDAQIAGARVEENKDKKHPADFALWKFSPKDAQRDMEWESPWGKGFPGWHLECSAMAIEYLGETIDIHAGGVDHIGVHHTNEIAQSEGATGKPYAQTWVHTEMMQVDGQKMSKSLGNSYILDDVEKHASFMAFRLLMLSSHYRSQQNFTWDSLGAAERSLIDLYTLADRQFTASADKPNPDLSNKLATFKSEFDKAIADDLNTPKALAALFNLAAFVDGISLNQKNAEALKEMLDKVDSVFGLGLGERHDLNAKQKALFEARDKARQGGNYSRSDEIREELAKTGIQVQDTPGGQRWTRIKL